MKKIFKKLFLLLAVVITAVVCFAFSASAISSNGKCGDYVSYTYNSTTKELIISGVGSMKNYSLYSKSPFYNSDIKFIVIENGVTSIGEYAFYNCHSLLSVVVSDSVKRIESCAFGHCENLTNITISSYLNTIGNYSFDFCKSLTDVYYKGTKEEWKAISLGLNNIFLTNARIRYEYGFHLNTIEYNIQNPTCNSIGYTAGTYCSECERWIEGHEEIPSTHTDFNDDKYCDICREYTQKLLKKGACGDNVYYKWYEDGMVIISGSGEMWDNINGRVSPFPFEISNNIVLGIVIENGVTKIGYGSFHRCNRVERIIIGSDVVKIGEHAFSECSDIRDVYYAGSNEKWRAIEIDKFNSEFKEATVYYNYCMASKSFIHKNQIYSEKEESSCTSVGYTAGAYCTDCEKWLSGHEELPILDHTDTDFDKFCDDCGSYTEKLYKTGFCGDNVTYEWYEDGMVIISGTGAMTNYRNYNSSPFYNSNIKNVIISDGVTTIGDWAFSYCYSLTEVTIGDGVTKIGNYAFYNYCALDSIVIPDCVTIIGDYAFSGDCFGSFSLKNVVIGNGVTSIGNYAFAGETSGTHLTNVTIGNNVKTIGKMAFFFSDKLTNLTIPDSVTTIGDGAFSNCFNLECITIGTGVTTIGDYAFDMDSGFGEPKLKNVIYSDSIASWRLINIGRFNNCLINANIIYSACNITTRLQQNATCTENGYTAGTYCPDCDSWLSGHTVISAKGHSYTEKIIDSAHLKSKATVEKSAVYKYDCANCDSISSDKTFTHGKALNLGTTSSVTATQTTSSVTLTWSKAENATGYRIYYKLPGDISWRTSVSYTTATTITYSKLPSGQSYCFAIRSAYKKTDGTYILGGYKEIATATKATAPADVYSFQNSSAIRLIWTASKGATGYRIYYKSGNTWKVCVSTTAATSHTFKNLKAGSKYTFAVRPYILADGVVIWSDYITITTATQTISPVITLTSTSKGNINLSWKAVNGAEAYQVYYKAGNGNYKLYKTYTSAQNLKFSNLKSGTKYTFAVRGVIKGSEENIYGFHSPVTVTVK